MLLLCHSGLDPESSVFSMFCLTGCRIKSGMTDPASSNVILSKRAGFPFDFALDREPVERPVEPRVKAGITKTLFSVVL